MWPYFGAFWALSVAPMHSAKNKKDAFLNIESMFLYTETEKRGKGNGLILLKIG
ncbi:MAG TPA: hypothetical protein VK168_08155 [Saprospiraceae bacterium]|nr:hypothetical protein [Saprospiraceae bacterium]